MSDGAFERIQRGTQEIVTEEELETVLDQDTKTAYIGFEPSGTAHLGWLICARKVRDLQDEGFEVTILLADWHAQINDKLDGDMDRIQACGRYMEEAFKALGVREDTDFTYASEWVSDPEYWATVLKVGKASTLNRIKRAMTIMGREAEDAELDYGKTIYPAMQVADIFYGDFDVALGGMDQRHAHMLARDVAKKLDLEAPVAVHTPILPSLAGEGRMEVSDHVEIDMEFGAHAEPSLIRSNLKTAGFSEEKIERALSEYSPESNLSIHDQVPWLGSKVRWSTEEKMSKSKPESGVFLHDEPEEVEAKVHDAYCPQSQVEGNPVLELLRYVVFPEIDSLTVERPEKYGGDLVFETYEEVEEAFTEGLHPLDLKKATADALNGVLQDIRSYFEEHPEGLKALEQALREA